MVNFYWETKISDHGHEFGKSESRSYLVDLSQQRELRQEAAAAEKIIPG
jgi:hypothetical protein